MNSKSNYGLLIKFNAMFFDNHVDKAALRLHVIEYIPK